MKILAIETSCDETSVAIVENGSTLLSHVLSSQIKTHKAFGGVVPEVASRMHTESINFLIGKALQNSNLTFKDLEAIAVTYGPGLEGALLIGITAAKTLATCLKIPLIPVNHLQGHLCAHMLSKTPIPFPFMALLISGGHTQLVLTKDHNSHELIGQTKDDAVGEAFDKVARLLGLPYPGGPEIEECAKQGNDSSFNFPRAMIKQGLDFSFSGLKTAVLQKINSLEKPLPVTDLAASFQKAVIDILIQKSKTACELHKVNNLIVTGGVAANQTLIDSLKDALPSIAVHAPEKKFCTDNAAMIGAAAYFIYQQKNIPTHFSVTPNLAL